MVTWNETKRQHNLTKHGIDFNDVDEIFDHPMLTREDDRYYADDELRLQSLALL
jgi:uncharacterized DUF497 family protein